MIMKKCLHVINKDGSEAKYHLQTTKLTTPSIGIRHHAMRNDAYVPLESMGSGGLNVGSVNVRYGGNNYLPKDWTPKLRFTYTARQNVQPYANPYYFSYLKIAMLNSVTINNPIYLYLEVGSQSQSWVNVLTLTAGGVSAEQSYSYSNGYRFSGSDNKGYIRIGNWTSSTFRINNSGTHNVDVTIPEAQWGV